MPFGPRGISALLALCCVVDTGAWPALLSPIQSQMLDAVHSGSALVSYVQAVSPVPGAYGRQVLDSRGPAKRSVSAHWRARGARGIRASSDSNFMSDAGHPALQGLTASSFDESPPSLRLGVAKDKEDNLHEVHLLWSPSGEYFSEGEVTQDDEVRVGKLEFTSADVPGKLKRILGVIRNDYPHLNHN